MDSTWRAASPRPSVPAAGTARRRWTGPRRRDRAASQGAVREGRAPESDRCRVIAGAAAGRSAAHDADRYQRRQLVTNVQDLTRRTLICYIDTSEEGISRCHSLPVPCAPGRVAVRSGCHHAATKIKARPPLPTIRPPTCTFLVAGHEHTTSGL